jgi:hypothetical protein
MRTLTTLALLNLAALPAAAGAQRSNHSISLESGVAAAAGLRTVPLALGASRWLDGDVHLVARLAFEDAPRTAGRAAAPALAGTAGLAWAPGTGPVRPRLLVEAGFVRRGSPGHVRGHGAFGAGGALEWFLARDVALQAGVAARRWGAWRLELVAGATLYF